MIKQKIFLLLMVVFLSFNLFAGCAVASEYEFGSFKSNIQNYGQVSEIRIEFKVKAKKDLNKITYTIDILDKEGFLVRSQEVTYIYNEKVNENSVTLTSYMDNESKFAASVKIRNLKCHYGLNWLYELSFGLLCASCLAFLLYRFILVKVREKKNRKLQK